MVFVLNMCTPIFQYSSVFKLLSFSCLISLGILLKFSHTQRKFFLQKMLCIFGIIILSLSLTFKPTESLILEKNSAPYIMIQRDWTCLLHIHNSLCTNTLVSKTLYTIFRQYSTNFVNLGPHRNLHPCTFTLFICFLNR